ncbi:hypothetical protein L596_027757 [Steinernema carpocapsae]|uniref:NTR domain-containing protein n=1 Tax=Steinernema carpocapsae TaxID=34508 RepID=A0A4U5LWF3_STECR|nr:hypothetical protein L596_027757 [Steinernema carpocapsae]
MLRPLPFLAFIGTAFACSCIPNTPKQIFCSAKWVGTFEIFGSSTLGATIYYNTRLLRVYKATSPIPNSGANISTPFQSAACGLQQCHSYLLTGKKSLKMLLS